MDEDDAADDLAMLLQGKAQAVVEEEVEKQAKPRLSLAVSEDACTADDSSSSSSSSSEDEAKGEEGGGEAEDAEDGNTDALDQEAADDAEDEEEAKIEAELSRLFEGDGAGEGEGEGEVGFAEEDLAEEGCEAAAAEEPGDLVEIQFEDEEEGSVEPASQPVAGDEKDEDPDGSCKSDGDNELLEDEENAGEADSDADSDASSSSSSSSAAPAALSDGASLLDLISNAAGDAATPEAPSAPAADGNGSKLGPTERALEAKLLADLRKLSRHGAQRATRFRQLAQWLRSKATEGFAGLRLSGSQVEALLVRVSGQLGGLPVPPAVAHAAGAPGGNQRSKPVNRQAGSGARQQPNGAPNACSRPGFSVPQHRDVPVPKRGGLKRRGAAVVSSVRKSISFKEIALVRVSEIVSHRDEDLWFTNPGQQVVCNYCGEQFEQVCGRLQGAEGRSQFAQSQFVCHPCLQTEWGIESEDE